MADRLKIWPNSKETTVKVMHEITSEATFSAEPNMPLKVTYTATVVLNAPYTTVSIGSWNNKVTIA